jgi:hypothetical protein
MLLRAVQGTPTQIPGSKKLLGLDFVYVINIAVGHLREVDSALTLQFTALSNRSGDPPARFRCHLPQERGIMPNSPEGEALAAELVGLRGTGLGEETELLRGQVRHSVLTIRALPGRSGLEQPVSPAPTRQSAAKLTALPLLAAATCLRRPAEWMALPSSASRGASRDRSCHWAPAASSLPCPHRGCPSGYTG